MSVRATGSAPWPRGSVVRGLAAAVAGGIALAASAQSYRIPDTRTPPPRVATAPRPGEPCEGCGRIVSIREINTTRGLPPATVRPVPGGGGDPSSLSQQNLIGAVIYLPLGRDGVDKPYIGGVGTPEMYERLRETTYDVTVKLDDGSYRSVRRADASRYGVGDRVRWISADELELLVN